jgi:5-methylcytosine-specific restriction endonuclease McrA
MSATPSRPRGTCHQHRRAPHEQAHRHRLAYASIKGTPPACPAQGTSCHAPKAQPMTSRTPPGRQNDARWKTAKARAIRDSDGYCQLCGNALVDAPRSTPWATEVDHILPLSQGGDPFDPGNLRALHRQCHQRRDQPRALPTVCLWPDCAATKTGSVCHPWPAGPCPSSSRDW